MRQTAFIANGFPLLHSDEAGKSHLFVGDAKGSSIFQDLNRHPSTVLFAKVEERLFSWKMCVVNQVSHEGITRVNLANHE